MKYIDTADNDITEIFQFVFSFMIILYFIYRSQTIIFY